MKKQPKKKNKKLEKTIKQLDYEYLAKCRSLIPNNYSNMNQEEWNEAQSIIDRKVENDRLDREEEQKIWDNECKETNDYENR